MHGYGVLYYPNGKPAYEGEWRNNQFEGRGTMYNQKPAMITINKFDSDYGKMENTWKKYEGEFYNDEWHGIGTLYFSNGDSYHGEFRHNKMHGKGSYYKSGGSVVNGIWENNCFCRAV